MPRHQVLQLITAIAWLQGASMSQAAPTIAKPGCNDTCGNIMIPYPFGIGPSCANSSWFEIFCNYSTSPPRPFLQRLNLEVMNMMLDDSIIEFDIKYHYQPLGLVVATQPLRVCAGEAAESPRPVSSIDLDGSPYRFSGYMNGLYAQFVTGCAGSVVMTNRSNQFVAACASVCSDNNSTTSNTCFGVGCCQSSIFNEDVHYPPLSFYQIIFSNDTVAQQNTCMDAGLVMLSQYQYLLDPQNLTRTPSPDNFPAILEWNFEGSPSCPYPYEGNGYDPSLCKFPRACKKCKGFCDVRWQDDGRWPIHFCRRNTLESIAPIVGSMAGIGLLLVAFSSYSLYRSMKRRKEIRKRAKYFKKNGGFLLQQEISQEGTEKTRIYTTDELEKATDKFNKNRILGKGGQGTVYKGMLPDGRIVAIKKSNQVVSDQLEQFINEVVILSQINHRNIVKLLGCCLETKVPLLVYEFIPNGTLAQHIQDPAQDFRISWKTRLQIAMETSGALSYLHSSSAAPIYHRDIKSSNMLLDSKYRAKVSDFGTSRTITIEQTHLTTSVCGTFGYLDPEYFQTNKFTEKSDVYSYGVVLVELLTSKKPVLETGPNEWRSLATEFLQRMGSTTLFDFLDNMVLQEAGEIEILVVANLAKRCLNMQGKLRPSMKEIVLTLQGVQSGQMHTSIDEETSDTLDI